MAWNSCFAAASSPCSTDCTRKSNASRSGPAPAQRPVELFLDPGDAAAVDIGEAEHVRCQVAVRVNPPLAVMEIDPRQAEPVDVIVLLRRQVARQPHETALA